MIINIKIGDVVMTQPEEKGMKVIHIVEKCSCLMSSGIEAHPHIICEAEDGSTVYLDEYDNSLKHINTGEYLIVDKQLKIPTEDFFDGNRGKFPTG